MTSEADIENAFVRYVEDTYEFPCLKLRIDGQRGFPDRTVITPGGLFFIEFKKGNNKLEPAQRKWKRRLTRLNQTCVAANSVEAAVSIFDAWLNGSDPS